MKVAVIGAGIIGVTTAYELSRDGHEVTVFERRSSVAAESSFAHAGVIAPGYMTPWAAPGTPAWMLGHLLRRHAPVRLRGLSSGTLPWLWRWWRARRLRTYRGNRLRLQRLALYSQQRLRDITRELKLDYERSEGYLVLLRAPKDLALVQPGLASLTELGTRFDLLDATQCRIVEPGLNVEAPLHAGIYLPQDEVGNCRQFSHLLRAEAQRLGARFRFRTRVQRIEAGPGPRVTHIFRAPDEAPTLMMTLEGDPQDTEPMSEQPITERFDAVIVCAALGSTELMRPLGLKLPLQAVHGYSITAPLRRSEGRADHGPRSALMDQRYQIAISRLGDRVRVAGGAEIGGHLTHQYASAYDTLFKVLHDWFPGSARLSHAQRWKGARPMLPDGPPVLGRSGSDGVWLNLGHGASGWALACGSARVLADALASRPATIDLDGLGVERLQELR